MVRERDFRERDDRISERSSKIWASQASGAHTFMDLQLQEGRKSENFGLCFITFSTTTTCTIITSSSVVVVGDDDYYDYVMSTMLTQLREEREKKLSKQGAIK